MYDWIKTFSSEEQEGLGQYISDDYSNNDNIMFYCTDIKQIRVMNRVSNEPMQTMYIEVSSRELDETLFLTLQIGQETSSSIKPNVSEINSLNACLNLYKATK